MQQLSSGMWDTPSELGMEIATALPHNFKDFPRSGWIRADYTDLEYDDFNYYHIAYTTNVDNLDIWEIDHHDETFKSKEIPWKDIVIHLFPALQQMISKYDVKQMIRRNCGDISDADFEKIFVELREMQLIKQEILTFPEGGGGVYFCLTNKGVKALLRYSK